jgi:tryptophanyl-tRNA synthetase
MPFKPIGSHNVCSKALLNQLSPCLRGKTTRRWQSSAPAPAKSKVVFSGIQPTGIPHLGNYLGALRQWAKLQETETPETRLLYSIVDLHAITVKQDPKQLKQWRRESLATLLAIGLDPSRSVIFYQSDVPAHSELMWILSCTASVGYLSRMTQWKVCRLVFRSTVNCVRLTTLQ